VKFQINSKRFLEMVAQAAEIALNNINIYASRSEITANKNSHRISFCVTPEELIINTFGDTAGIVIQAKRRDGYIYQESGFGSVNEAKHLMTALKSRSADYSDIVVSTYMQYLTLAPCSNEDDYSAVRMTADTYPLPLLPRKHKQRAIVDTAYFLKGLKKIRYAQATTERESRYMCVLFQSKKHGMQFTAGNGGRFAIVEYESDTEMIASGEMTVILPTYYISNMIRILDQSSSATVKITTYDREGIIHGRITLETEDMAFHLYDLEDFKDYPDLSRVFQYDYPYQISTPIKEWKAIVDDLAESKPLYKQHLHNTNVVADLLHGHFDIATKAGIEVKKRIPFALGTYVTDPKVDNGHKPWFCVNSDHLLDVGRKFHKDDTVTVHFEDQSIPASLPTDQPRRMKPILIKALERLNNDGVREKQCMFFTTSFR
jgi:hypothetical protein